MQLHPRYNLVSTASSTSMFADFFFVVIISRNYAHAGVIFVQVLVFPCLQFIIYLPAIC